MHLMAVKTRILALVLLSVGYLFYSFGAMAQDKAKPPKSIQAEDKHNKKLLQRLSMLPVEVTQVIEVCPWRTKKAKGVIRVIHTQESLANKLYLQWVRLATQNEAKKVISTVEVKELSEQQGYQFKTPSAELRRNLCILSTKGIKISDKRLQRITLNLMGFGDYKILIHPILSDTSYLDDKSNQVSPSLRKAN